MAKISTSAISVEQDGGSMADDLLTDLEDLLSHKGWMWLMEHADKEWGRQGFAEKIARTLGQPKATPEARELALHQLEQATVAQDAVWRVMRAPQEKVQRIRSQQKEALLAGTASRRGPGL